MAQVRIYSTVHRLSRRTLYLTSLSIPLSLFSFILFLGLPPTFTAFTVFTLAPSMAFRGVRQRRPRRPVMHPPRYPTAAASSSGVTLAGGAPSPPPASAAAPTSPLSGTLRAAMLGVPAGMRLALAGGLSGAAVHTALHPLDTLKTVRQADPALRSATLRSALGVLLARARGPGGGAAAGVGGAPASAGAVAAAAAGAAARTGGGGRPPPPALLAVLPALYRGVVPAALGAAPSSALYFGMYEAAKRALHARFLRPSEPGAPTRRLALNCLSAAAGNVASSVLFVPKEVIKQRLQTGLSPSVPAAVASLVAGGGVRALYRGYGVTLARNIPSAVLKFSLYEEAKVALRRRKAAAAADAAAVVGPGEATVRSRLRWSGLDHVICGAVAGAAASGLTTPLDVVKTRFAVLGGDGRGAWAVARSVVAEGGVGGLFAGVQPRMVWSALFTAMGFGTYEAFKRLLVPEGVVAEVGGDTPPTGTRVSALRRGR